MVPGNGCPHGSVGIVDVQREFNFLHLLRPQAGIEHGAGPDFSDRGSRYTFGVARVHFQPVRCVPSHGNMRPGALPARAISLKPGKPIQCRVAVRFHAYPREEPQALAHLRLHHEVGCRIAHRVTGIGARGDQFRVAVVGAVQQVVHFVQAFNAQLPTKEPIPRACRSRSADPCTKSAIGFILHTAEEGTGAIRVALADVLAMHSGA